MYMTGYFWLDIKRDEKVSYKEYLGPDWKPEWEGAPTYIQNHTSFLDIMLALYTIFPSFVARENVKHLWGIGTIADTLKSVYVRRVGVGAKESKKEILKAIE
jgi:1-acyl-sn-glycerol-3-phosphate acyltransferase